MRAVLWQLLIFCCVVIFPLMSVAAPKNVVLIVADDLGRDLGCYGNTVIKTPHLDRIAADGTLFEHAFCTTASCSPSRSVLLSGQHNHTNGQYGLQHSVHHFQSFDQVRSLSGRLRAAGYRTARVGKFHVAPDEVYPFDQALQGNARNGTQMAEHCRELVSATSDKPFFLYFCTADPHRDQRYGAAPYRPNLFGNDATKDKANAYDPRDVIVPPCLPDTPTSRAELAQYYQAVSRADQGVGRLVELLKEAGHWDDTLLVFLSDNGIPFPGAKTTVYDPGLRLPCLIRDPSAAKRGVRSNAMISWVDIAPTILQYAGAAVPPGELHGRSLLGILEQEDPQGWDEIFASHTFHEVTMYYPMRAVRTRKHKLIWNIAHGLPFPFAADLYESATWQEARKTGSDAKYGPRTIAAYVNRPKFELYDLERDPDESVNLAENPGHAQTMAELQERIRAFQKRTADPWLHKWNYE